jgi:hypothetical protein
MKNDGIRVRAESVQSMSLGREGLRGAIGVGASMRSSHYNPPSPSRREERGRILSEGPTRISDPICGIHPLRGSAPVPLDREVVT